MTDPVCGEEAAWAADDLLRGIEFHLERLDREAAEALIERFRAIAIAAHTAALREAGFVIVPMKPTDKMVENAAFLRTLVKRTHSGPAFYHLSADEIAAITEALATLEAFKAGSDNDIATMKANAELIAERDNLKALMKRREGFILGLLWNAAEKHEALEKELAGARALLEACQNERVAPILAHVMWLAALPPAPEETRLPTTKGKRIP